MPLISLPRVRLGTPRDGWYTARVEVERPTEAHQDGGREPGVPSYQVPGNERADGRRGILPGYRDLKTVASSPQALHADGEAAA